MRAKTAVNDPDPTTGNTLLIEAITRDSIPLARVLVTSGADITVRNSAECSAIDVAMDVDVPSVAMMRMLLDAAGPAGAELLNPTRYDTPSNDAKDKEGKSSPSLLTSAVAKGFIDLTRMLLEAKASPNPHRPVSSSPSPSVVPSPHAPLFSALTYEPSARLATLLNLPIPSSLAKDKDGKDNAKDTTSSSAALAIKDSTSQSRSEIVLKRAVAGLSVQMVRLLMDADADVNIADETGTTPLLYALKAENIDLTRVFLAAGADVCVSNKAGDVPLSIISQMKNNGEMLKEAIDAGGANAINVADEEGENMLSRAIMNLQFPFAKTLIERTTSTKNDTSTKCVQATPETLTVALKQLLEVSMDVADADDVHPSDTEDDDPWEDATELTIEDITRQDIFNMARSLLAAKADVNAETSDGTMLTQAISTDFPELAELALDHNSVVHPGQLTELIQFALDDTSTPARAAVISRLPQKLIEHKADVNEVSEGDRETPLLALCNHHGLNDMKYVKLLLDNKADVEAVDKHGHSAINAAFNKHSDALLKMLLAAGANPCVKDSNGVYSLKGIAEAKYKLVADYCAKNKVWTKEFKEANDKLKKKR
jgi:ankyrin repeat protein